MARLEERVSSMVHRADEQPEMVFDTYVINLVPDDDDMAFGKKDPLVQSMLCYLRDNGYPDAVYKDLGNIIPKGQEHLFRHGIPVFGCLKVNEYVPDPSFETPLLGDDASIAHSVIIQFEGSL